MIDLKRATLLYDKRAGYLSPHSPRHKFEEDNFRRALWACLLHRVQPDGTVRVTHPELAQAIAVATEHPAPPPKRINAALTWLRRANMLSTQGHDPEVDGYLYRLHIPGAAAPRKQRRTSVASNPRLEAFDRRAVGWSLERRRAWRCVWRVLLRHAGTRDLVAVDLGGVTDQASDLLGRDIADETVARLLAWSVMSRLTVQVHHGPPPIYRLL
jgi:hypothetical protein